jgi:hypothetical protein
LDLAPKAILLNDAVLFAGDVHLYQGAQVRGDVIVVQGNATLDGGSLISGKLYLSPLSNRGHLEQSSEAQVMRGVVKPANIERIAGWRAGRWFTWQVLKIILLIVLLFCLLLAFIFYLGRRTRTRKSKDGAGRREAESSTQSTTPAGI